MQALKAEIFPTFHKAEYNHRFSSAEQDGKGFRLMFPGHPSEGNYRCSPQSLHIFSGMVSVKF